MWTPSLFGEGGKHQLLLQQRWIVKHLIKVKILTPALGAQGTDWTLTTATVEFLDPISSSTQDSTGGGATQGNGLF